MVSETPRGLPPFPPSFPPSEWPLGSARPPPPCPSPAQLQDCRPSQGCPLLVTKGFREVGYGALPGADPEGQRWEVVALGAIITFETQLAWVGGGNRAPSCSLRLRRLSLLLSHVAGPIPWLLGGTVMLVSSPGSHCLLLPFLTLHSILEPGFWGPTKVGILVPVVGCRTFPACNQG